MPRNYLNELMPLAKCGLQPYFTNRIQLADVIEWIIDQTGPANVVVSTFSTGEEFLRRMHRLKTSGRALYCELFCDLRAARKTAALFEFVKSIFQRVCLCQNHSKVVLVFNNDHRVSVVTSQNQTRGDRFEAGVITSDRHLFDTLHLSLSAMADNSVSIDELYNRTARQDN